MNWFDNFIDVFGRLTEPTSDEMDNIHTINTTVIFHQQENLPIGNMRENGD